jgi:nucleoside 2-deoxyribosyltransferase
VQKPTDISKLYLAGPLFTVGEKLQNEVLAGHLRDMGYECFLPQESEENQRAVSAQAIFENDVAGMDWADAIVACIDGPDPDSGTSWELGYMFAKGKPAVLYRTDFRTACGDFDGQPVNLMLSAHVHPTNVITGGVTTNGLTLAQAINRSIRSHIVRCNVSSTSRVYGSR